MSQLPLLSAYGQRTDLFTISARTKFGSDGGQAHWLRLCRTEAYEAMRDKSLMVEAAAATSLATANAPLTILTIGTGDGKQEVRYIRRLKNRIVRILPHGIDTSEERQASERLSEIRAEYQPLSIGGMFEEDESQRTNYQLRWNPGLERAANNLTVSFGNTIGNLLPTELIKLLSKIRRAQEMYQWDTPEEPTHLLLEWTAPYVGDRRPGMIHLPTDTEIGRIEHGWYDWCARKKFWIPQACPVDIRFETYGPYPDGGYELIGIATILGDHPRAGEQVVVARFFRYSPEAMIEAARQAGFDPVRNCLFQNGPSTIMILKSRTAATHGTSARNRRGSGPHKLSSLI